MEEIPGNESPITTMTAMRANPFANRLGDSPEMPTPIINLDERNDTVNPPIPAFVAVASARATEPSNETPRAPAREERMRAQVVFDPVVGDTVNCNVLADRERACWAAYDAAWPGGIPAPGSPDRQAAITLQRAGRWRARALQRTCGVWRVRVG